MRTKRYRALAGITGLTIAFAGLAVSTTAQAATIAIVDIQGTGATSPLVGQIVTTEGVVTAVYDWSVQQGGYYGFIIQTPGSGGQTSVTALTGSSAVFVYIGATNALGWPAKGDLVEVTGRVDEYNGSANTLTEVNLSGVAGSGWTKIGTAAQPAPVAIPWTELNSDALRERIESMLYLPPEGFTITDTYSVNQSARIGLAYGDGPLMQPTDVAAVSDAAGIAAQQAENDARFVWMDDGAVTNFLASGTIPSRSALPWVTADGLIRVGAKVTLTEPMVLEPRGNTANTTGLAWQLNPTYRYHIYDNQYPAAPATPMPVSIAPSRPAAPEAVNTTADGVSVATFNVLNYFTTTGVDWNSTHPADCTSYNAYGISSAGFPVTVNTCASGVGPRGAWDSANLQRQQDKIVAAINGLDASVVGLMEVENSIAMGKTADAALVTLVGALNSAAGNAKWDYVPTPAALQALPNRDVINVALIYQPAQVTPVGAPVALTTESATGGAFANAREPIGQAFEPAGGGDSFFVAVNHFKSKGSCAIPGDTGSSDIQGACNGSRVRQADALATWVENVALPSYTTKPVEAAVLLGDFNAYTREDPILKLETHGYEDVNLLEGNHKQTYSFDSKNGSLDHILVNQAAQDRLEGHDIWNINSPESIALEYTRYRYNRTDFYTADAYRSSDHDPAKIGLAAAAPPAGPDELVFLTVNDFHGRIDQNTAAYACTVATEQAKAPATTTFIGAGDLIGASLFASALDQDRPTLDVLGELGMAASSVGNHEFDRGLTDLVGRVIGTPAGTGDAPYPYLAANAYFKGTTVPAFRASTTLTVGSHKVGLIGAVTTETPALVSPAGVAAVDFGDPVQAINREAGLLKAAGADVIVAIIHDGSSQGQADGTINDAMSASAGFARLVEQIDPSVNAIVNGHTHQAYAWAAPLPGSSDTRPVVQAAAYGAIVGKITLTFDDQGDLTHSQELIPRMADASACVGNPVVDQVETIVNNALAAATAEGSKVVGAISADITTAFANGSYSGPAGAYTGGTRDDRAAASAMGTLVGNALRETLDPLGGVDIGVVNPGGLRAELYYSAAGKNNGEVTVAEARAVLPFDNTLAIVELTGAQLFTMLAQQWQRDAAGAVPSRPYLQLGLSDNVTYTFLEINDPVIPGAKLGQITSVTVNGVEVDPAATYKVATFSFLAEGGDNFWVFQESANVIDTGLLDWEGWLAYFEANKVPPLAPNFQNQGWGVDGLPSVPVEAGSSFSFDLFNLNVRSLGALETTSLDVVVGSGGAVAVPVVDGAASVTLTAPAAAGAYQITITNPVTGASVKLPLQVKATFPSDFNVTVKVSGSAKPGATLTGKVTGQPAGASVTYQWFRNGSAIGGATSGLYKVQAADAGKTLSLKVTVKSGNVTKVVTSSGVAVAKPAVPTPSPTPTPTVPGGQAAKGMAQIVLSPSLAGALYGDVLAVDQTGNLWRYPSSASGALGKAAKIGTGWGDLTLYAPGDWDKDGTNDLIAVDEISGKMYLFPGTGKGGIGAKRQIGQGWSGYRVIPAGDLNGDGNVDLLAIKEATGDLYLYAGKGDGGFQYPYPKVGYGWKGFDLYAASDVDKDGKADILSIDAQGNLYFYAGKGDGTFAKKIKVGYGWKGYDLSAGADLNGSGMADIVSRFSDGTLYFYAAKGGGLFSKKVQIGTGF